MDPNCSGKVQRDLETVDSRKEGRIPSSSSPAPVCKSIQIFTHCTFLRALRNVLRRQVIKKCHDNVLLNFQHHQYGVEFHIQEVPLLQTQCAARHERG